MSHQARHYKQNREDWGTITDKRKNGRWTASYVGPDGNRYYGPVIYTSRTDARGWLAKQRTSIGNGTWRSPKSVSAENFGTYARTWVDERRSSKGAPLAPTTRNEYLRQLDKGLSVFAKDHLPAITMARVRTWHHDRAKAGATTAAREAALLRAIMNDAVRDKIITDNPVPKALTRSSTGQKHRPPTDAELATILDTIGPRFRVAVAIAALGGLRIGEWKALRRSDLVRQADGRYAVTIERQAQYVAGEWHVGPPKSAAGIRIWVAPDHLSQMIDDHLQNVGPFPGSLLFAPTSGADFIHDSTFRTPWDKARDAAGVRGIVREHDLRGYALTAIMVAGATLKETMAFGGHSTPAAALVYQHAARERLDDLSNRVPALPSRSAASVPRIGS
jgi:integrase